jgi:hypothetical protein
MVILPDSWSQGWFDGDCRDERLWLADQTAGIAWGDTEARQGKLPDPMLTSALLEAGHWFRLRHPELVGAIAEYERSSRNWATEAQDFFASHGLRRGHTFGPFQFNPDTIEDIEIKFLGNHAIPNDLREHLLPRSTGYEDRLRRAQDPHWARSYLAAMVYLWEMENPGDSPVDFYADAWNPRNPNATGPDPSKQRAGWKEQGPELLLEWAEMDRMRRAWDF